jgi:DNA modification methylase
MSQHTLHLGDCLDVLRTMPDCSVDAVVTDPPYGLAFMGKRWDYDVPSVEVWAECLRVLKPGGHLLAFAGTRTQHRMAVRIEDAGFEIRDMIAWVYGSGFPKSLDVSKAIDKRGGNSHLAAEIGAALKAARKSRGITATEADRTYCGGVTLWSWYEGRPAGQQMPTADVMARVAADWPELRHYADLIAEAEREVVGQKTAGIANPDDRDRHTIGGSASVVVDITAPATPEAQQWAGWGTALKPALEPITMARKPLTGTVAANVLQHGTGALNVDGCRVEGAMTGTWGARQASSIGYGGTDPDGYQTQQHPLGRWPANLIHDGSDEVVGLFPETTSGAFNQSQRKAQNQKYGQFNGYSDPKQYDSETGNAARFFYTSKATKAERQGCSHPTVKPLDLMAYLCRLVTPPGGIVLDPFMGSGTTIKAAIGEGFNAIGIERDPAYYAMAQHRMDGAQIGLALEAA